MFWRFFLLNCLLVVPTSRIITAANVDYRTGSVVATDEELVDEIIRDLQTSLKAGNEPPKTQKSAPLESSPDKKDESAGQKVSANNNDDGINLAADVSGVQTAAPTKKTVPQKETDKTKYAPPGKSAPLQQPEPSDEERHKKFMEDDDKTFVLICAMAAVTGFVGILMAGVCYYKFRKSHKAATDVEYPAYGVTGPTKERIPSPGDRKLAQSAQMYHYQHQKQQMIAMEKANGDMKHDASDDDSEEDNIEGDYTVYECPGLAPTGEMEVKNPLFRGDDTPVNPNRDINTPP